MNNEQLKRLDANKVAIPVKSTGKQLYSILRSTPPPIESAIARDFAKQGSLSGRCLQPTVSTKFNDLPFSLRAADKLQTFITNLMKHIFQTI